MNFSTVKKWGLIIIKINELNNVLKNDNCAFLCGNGFSINFDNEFANIYSKLYSSHKELIYNSEYIVKANNKFKKKFKNNYNNVFKYIKYINQSEFYKIFEDALIFANTIIKNKKLIDELKSKGKITKLSFGFSELDILKNICSIGNKKGIKSVNIENWSILIYFYHSIVLLNTDIYEFPDGNSFVTIAKIGSNTNIELIDKEDAKMKTVSNGFITYYRFLLSIAIYLKGKSIDINKLQDIDRLNLNKIITFLNKFNVIMTLNYDLIMENLISKNIEHLHGKFVINQKQYVYHQRFLLKTKDMNVDFSDILIGDYFVFKVFLPVVNNLASGDFNKKQKNSAERIKSLITEKSINTIVIFGMNINNDYHILRQLMIGMFFAKIINPKIIYCYFHEKEKMEFKKQFKKVITYSDKLNNYSNNIKLSFIKTQDILNNIFYKSVT